MTRRASLRIIVGAGAALVGVAAGGHAVLANHTSQLYTVSANANFRRGPSTSYAILGVVRPGNTFILNGQTQNGYAGITYQGQSGWVIAHLVVAASSTPTTPVIDGVGWTTSAVNLRSGPSTSHQVLRVVPKDAKIGTSTTERNGFLYVSHNGLAGWMSTSFIAYRDAPSGPVYDPNSATATANLNLRAEPSLSAKILLVIPSGARVRMEGGGSGQFSKVSYNGTSGYAATAYLN